MRAEFNAFKTELGVPAQLAGRVDTTVKLDASNNPVRTNYVIAYPDVPTFDDARFMGVQTFDSTREVEYKVRFVAVDADGVLILAEAGMKHMVNLVLTVPGRVCDAIRVDAQGELGRVEFDRASRLFFMDVVFMFTSRRA